MEASSGPSATPADIWSHFRHRNADGTALSLGAKPGGVTLVAVHGTAKAWQDWMAEHAIVERHDFDGRTVTDRLYRDAGRFVSVSWQPPAAPFRSSGVAFGQAQMDAMAHSMRPRPLDSGEAGWLIWAAAPSAGRSLTFRNRKTGHGLEVLADGVVPMHHRRGDGWTLNASGVPLTELMPQWLAVELGGRFKRSAAA